MLPLTPKLRRRLLDKRLAIWEPRIGAEATNTDFRSFEITLFSMSFLVVWFAVILVVSFAGAASVAIALLLFFFVAPIGLVRAMQLSRRARHQASKVAATKDMAVPTRGVGYFDRWAATSEFSRSRK